MDNQFPVLIHRTLGEENLCCCFHLVPRREVFCPLEGCDGGRLDGAILLADIGGSGGPERGAGRIGSIKNDFALSDPVDNFVREESGGASENDPFTPPEVGDSAKD
jgi:hypothetical protein